MKRRSSLAAVSAVALMTMSACTAQDPSAQRVVRELIESLAPNADVEQCMLERLDAYDRDELDAIGDALIGDNVSARADAEEQLADFEADLGRCN